MHIRVTQKYNNSEKEHKTNKKGIRGGGGEQKKFLKNFQRGV